MSKLDNVRFCDKCLTAIPTGDVYYEKTLIQDDKDYCSKCKKKNSFFRACVGALLLALTSVGGYVTYDRLDERVETNTDSIEIVAEYTLQLENKVKRAFKQVSGWAQTVESRLQKFHRTHAEESRLLQRTLERIDAQTKAIAAAQKKLVNDLTTGKMTDDKIVSAIAMLQIQQKETEEQLQIILRNPQEVINKVIRPTVGIAVRDTKSERLRGSGVLFRREKFIDTKTKKVMYRYYGFTCYHVWAGVFKYYEDIKKPDKPDVALPNGRIAKRPKLDRTLAPQLVLYYYDGNSKYRSATITGAKFVGITHYMKEFRPQQDFSVFTFVTGHDDIAIAELASDEEIKRNVYYGSRVYTTGIAIGGVPSLYFGTTGNPNLPGDGGILFQAFGYYGQSGGPIFDARTLKVISINQRVRVHPILGGMDSAPLSNTIFGTLLTEIREVWRNTAPKQDKKLLD